MNLGNNCPMLNVYDIVSYESGGQIETTNPSKEMGSTTVLFLYRYRDFFFLLCLVCTGTFE